MPCPYFINNYTPDFNNAPNSGEKSRLILDLKYLRAVGTPEVLVALELFGRRKITQLEGRYSGATGSASCLLAGHLFLHLLLHFLRCGFRLVGSDHPGVTLGIDNGPTAVPPKHIHHWSLGRGPE